jgi:hypothetical protein
VGQKKIPTVGVFPTVLVFSYCQINPTVKMPRLGCTHFVVPQIIPPDFLSEKRKSAKENFFISSPTDTS